MGRIHQIVDAFVEEAVLAFLQCCYARSRLAESASQLPILLQDLLKHRHDSV
jgi:hypothetical protein